MNLLSRALIAVFISILLLACEQERQQPTFEFSLNNPAEIGSRYPNLHQDDSGTITMSWISGIDEEIYAIEFTTYNEEGWTPPRTVGLSTNYFVNFADFPSVVSLDGEVVAAHWLRKIPGGPYAYNVNIAFPAEEARRWTDPITPHRDGTATEHGFVSMEPLDSDRVLAIWLDGRNTEDRGHDEYDDPEKAMTLRSAEVSRDGSLTREREIDAMICDCCSTDMVLSNGRALAVYRDRTEDEIRDISIASYDLETGEWSDPRPVHEDGWQISGCPVNGPRIDANGDLVAVSWYTEADDDSVVKVAVSRDGGDTFGDPVVVAREYAQGRADLAIGDDGKIYVSWLAGRNGTGYVMMRTLSPENELGEPLRVGITSSSRRSGFPRIAPMDKGIFFAWTQTEPLIRVRTAFVRFEQLAEAEEM
ncbi:exo-alpha-sialidase [Rhodohalobacter sp. SW132]|uniref:sialidase family protein n=1 Tax=Rhodohalobacter sp. SW132 TaxID=2293433 RepID=UPI000E24F3AC|nr:sialidase family protein [Rhodohalobacter sp. SW132]REL33459.1 exo-alpha-sialidase [Rhodohalobacter sp. SW132]